MTNMTTDDATSWLAEPIDAKPSSWTYGEKSNMEPKQIREINKRLRAIYAEAGLAYGADVSETELAARFKIAADLRKANIKGVFKSIRQSKNVEVCFLMDATGSMQPHIDGVKNSIIQIITLLKQPAPTTLASRRKNPAPTAAQLRLSMVAYRDFGDSKQIEILPFTESAEEFKAFCGNIRAEGGGDGPEDVFGGFRQALRLGWSEECGTKVIFHIADAPCHGRKYHNFVDTYPEGDPAGNKECEIFPYLLDEGIDYYFGNIIPENTDRMIAMFSKAYGKEITQFAVKDVQAIANSVFTAVSTSVFFSTKARDSAKKVRTYKIDPEPPDWLKIPKLSGRFVTFALPKSIEDVINDVPLERSSPKHAIVKVAPSPFAQGAERYAFYGKDHSTPSDPKSIVFKEYKIIGTGNPASRYECTNQVQTIASFFAVEYNNALRDQIGFHYFLKFLKVQTLCIQINDKESRYLCCEKRYGKDDKFVRFTNNSDYEIMAEAAKKMGLDNDFVSALTAFSHWTYQITTGKLMVVDLQGITFRDADGNLNAILTDPAIHCVDETRFGCMNLGIRGMEIFFRRHQCNKYCEALNLNPVG